MFQMWSVWHILFILSPFLIFIILYFSLRKTSLKTRYIVGVVIGVLNTLVLVVRNIDLMIKPGFDPEIIPLQVCHLGNIFALIALTSQNKIFSAVLWSLNLPTALIAIVYASALTNYPIMWAIRPLSYILGHIFIVVAALYVVGLKLVKLDLKSFLWGTLITFGLMVVATVLNCYFNDKFDYGDYRPDYTINMFYMYDSRGTPLGFLYNLGKRYTYGWFSINWVYNGLLSLIGLVGMFGVFSLSYLFHLKPKKKKEIRKQAT